MCFDFTPAPGESVDSWEWIVLSPYSDTCLTSLDDETFCYEACYNGQFEIAVVASYDNGMYRCTTYRQFNPPCAPNPCNPFGPPKEDPAIGVVYLEAHCGGSLFALKTYCTCVDYEYDVMYARPSDLTIPCLGTDTIHQKIHMGPCECRDTITVAQYKTLNSDGDTVLEHYPIYVRAVLPEGCCNTAYEKCVCFVPVIDTNYLNICRNCSCSSSGCTVKTWHLVTKDCTPDIQCEMYSSPIHISKQEEGMDRIDRNQEEDLPGIRLTNNNISRIEIYDVRGMLRVKINTSGYKTMKIKEIIRSHLLPGLNIIKLIYTDGSFKVQKRIIFNGSGL